MVCLARRSPSSRALSTSAVRFSLLQVDEVDHDTAHIPQAQLPRDLGRRRQVDVHGRLLLVVVHFGAVAAVDVHHV